MVCLKNDATVNSKVDVHSWRLKSIIKNEQRMFEAERRKYFEEITASIYFVTKLGFIAGMLSVPGEPRLHNQVFALISLWRETARAVLAVRDCST